MEWKWLRLKSSHAGWKEQGLGPEFCQREGALAGVLCLSVLGNAGLCTVRGTLPRKGRQRADPQEPGGANFSKPNGHWQKDGLTGAGWRSEGPEALLPAPTVTLHPRRPLGAASMGARLRVARNGGSAHLPQSVQSAPMSSPNLRNHKLHGKVGEGKSEAIMDGKKSRKPSRLHHR